MAVAMMILIVSLWGCKNNNKDVSNMNINTAIQQEDIKDLQLEGTNRKEEEDVINISEKHKPTKDSEIQLQFNNMEYALSYKKTGDFNPLMTQDFGADPFAMVYEDRVYVYMTQDVLMFDKDNNVIDNSFGNINKLRVISSGDLVNWTDHGNIHIGGAKGVTYWANCSWAPAVAWREIDGKDQFFIYFSNSGGGIGVLTADTPIGPFRDKVGKALIDNNTPNCQGVTWVFDPAVLVDDDGRAFLYFGGGIPEDDFEWPNTARVIELGTDMMSIVGEAIVIEAPYMFESSGINKIEDTYYYTYCSNFGSRNDAKGKNVPNAGEVIYMTSKSPIGPWGYQGSILKNPGYFFETGGNNHHSMIEFKEKYYMFYHTSVLQDAMGIKGGYRSTHINEVDIKNGVINPIMADKVGAQQIKPLDPYKQTEAVTMSNNAGIKTIQTNIKDLVQAPKVYLNEINHGDWISLSQVDFGSVGPDTVTLCFASDGESGAIKLSVDSLEGEIVSYIEITNTKSLDNFIEVTVPVANITGIHDVYFAFAGSGYCLDYWKFNKN